MHILGRFKIFAGISFKLVFLDQKYFRLHIELSQLKMLYGEGSIPIEAF
jgi:hypothetical protein